MGNEWNSCRCPPEVDGNRPGERREQPKPILRLLDLPLKLPPADGSGGATHGHPATRAGQGGARATGMPL